MGKAKEKRAKTMNIRCSKELIEALKSGAQYGDTLEDVIWRLIGK